MFSNALTLPKAGLAPAGFTWAIKYCCVLVLALLPTSALAGEDVDLTRPFDGNGTIEIYNTRGEVDIEGWDRPEVHVVGELDDLAEGILFEVEDDRVIVRVRIPDRHVNWGDGSDLKIRVPRSSFVSFRGVDTDVSLTEIEGGMRVDTVSGDVKAQEIGTRIRIKTISGRVEIKKSAGPLRVSSVSGDLRLDVTSTEVEIDAVSADLDGIFEALQSLDIRLVSGEADLSATLGAEASLRIESVNGDISLRLAEPVDAKIEVRTGPGGDIENDLSDDAPTRTRSYSQQLNTALGNGTSRVQVYTVTGDVSVRSR